MIILNNISKGKIRNLTLYIKSGEMVCINDEKSSNVNTLFKLLSGQEKPDEGVIRYLDKGVYSTKAPKNLLGFVYKNNILLPDRTLKENLQYIMQIRELDMHNHQIMIRRILDIVDLKHCIHKKPGDLLKHQIIRANIAQGILNYPPVLVLEDPCLDLDEVNTQGIIHLIKRLNKFSMTIILLSSSRKLLRGKDLRLIKMNNIFTEKKKDYYG